MTTETLLHIDETLSTTERDELLRWFGNSANGIHPHVQTEKHHLMFVAYNPEEMCPHDLVVIAGERGVHAHVIDF